MGIFGDYEIVARDGYFEFRHKTGEVLLLTQRVSLDTLIRLTMEDEIVVERK